MSSSYPFLIGSDFRGAAVESDAERYGQDGPFRHIVLDDFLPSDHVQFLSNGFPQPDHPVWLRYENRSPHQYGKLGPGNSTKFDMLDPRFRLALQEFNQTNFLR